MNRKTKHEKLNTMSKSRCFAFIMTHPILCRIFYHQNTEAALLVANGHMESLMETKPCYLPWGILTNNTRHLLPSEQSEKRTCTPIPSAEQSACRTRRAPLSWGPLDSMGGSHSMTLPESDCKEFLATDTHLFYPAIAFPFYFSLSLSLF